MATRKKTDRTAAEAWLSEPVTVRLFRDNGSYKEDKVVTVNGETVRIPRGEDVTIPRRFALVLAEHAHEALLEFTLVEELQLVEDRRQRLARRVWQSVAVAIVVSEAVIDDRLRHRLATDTAHGTRLLLDDD